MSKHCKGFKNFVGAGGEHKDPYGKFKKLVRNSEFSKSDISKELSVLAQILSFL